MATGNEGSLTHATFRIGLIDGDDIAWDWTGLAKEEAKRVMLELSDFGLRWFDFRCEAEREEAA